MHTPRQTDRQTHAPGTSPLVLPALGLQASPWGQLESSLSPDIFGETKNDSGPPKNRMLSGGLPRDREGFVAHVYCSAVALFIPVISIVSPHL